MGRTGKDDVMQSLADRMTELLKQEKYRKDNSKEYINGYIDGAMDMHNEALKHIKEVYDDKANSISNTQTDKEGNTKR